MTTTKEILESLCHNLERDLNDRHETPYKRTVRFFSGRRSSDYYLPNIHIGKCYPKEGHIAWFVEVSVDGDVIFRESHIPSVDEDLREVESFLADRVLRHIFTFGVMESKKFIDSRKQQL